MKANYFLLLFLGSLIATTKIAAHSVDPIGGADSIEKEMDTCFQIERKNGTHLALGNGVQVQSKSIALNWYTH